MTIVVLVMTAGSSQRHGYSYHDDYYASHYGDRHYEEEDRYHRYYDRMSRSDRRCYRDLVDKLERRRRRGWEDGHLSDRDRRRIREVQYDLDDLIAKYRRYRPRYRERRPYTERVVRSLLGCR